MGPIEYTGKSEQFEVNVTEEEVVEMMDDNVTSGTIKYLSGASHVLRVNLHCCLIGLLHGCGTTWSI